MIVQKLSGDIIMIFQTNNRNNFNLQTQNQLRQNNNPPEKIANEIIKGLTDAMAIIKLKIGDRFIFEAQCSLTNEKILHAVINVGEETHDTKHFVYIVDERSFPLNISLPLTPENVIRNSYFCSIEGNIKWLNAKEGEIIRNIFCNNVENAVVKLFKLNQLI